MFKGLLNETKGFKYQITLKVELKNISPNKLNFKKFVSIQQKKTVTNHKLGFDKCFQEIFYRIDNWINEGSGRIVDLIESQYFNSSIYRSLLGSSYINFKS